MGEPVGPCAGNSSAGDPGSVQLELPVQLQSPVPGSVQHAAVAGDNFVPHSHLQKCRWHQAGCDMQQVCLQSRRPTSLLPVTLALA